MSHKQQPKTLRLGKKTYRLNDVCRHVSECTESKGKMNLQRNSDGLTAFLCGETTVAFHDGTKIIGLDGSMIGTDGLLSVEECEEQERLVTSIEEEHGKSWLCTGYSCNHEPCCKVPDYGEPFIKPLEYTEVFKVSGVEKCVVLRKAIVKAAESNLRSLQKETGFVMLEHFLRHHKRL